jgi:hypothetical protein
MKIGEGSASLQFDHTVLAELIARRWKQDRRYFTLNERACGAWLQASRWPQPGRSALGLHWSRHSPLQAVFDGAGISRSREGASSSTCDVEPSQNSTRGDLP